VALGGGVQSAVFRCSVKIEMATLQEHLLHAAHGNLTNHLPYLLHLKRQGFEPRVIYDIGSCVAQWTNQAKRVWPDAKYILFDAFEPAEFLYSGYDYHIGVLSDRDDRVVKFYQNDWMPTGNSYYREVGHANGALFPVDSYTEKVAKTLDTVVKQRGFPLPDLVKIDVQGSELDVLQGATHTIAGAQHMIVELQHTNYNDGAPKVDTSLPFIENLGWRCVAPLFANNGPDGDYGFVKN
jgi:FkbM family methyltransferase